MFFGFSIYCYKQSAYSQLRENLNLTTHGLTISYLHLGEEVGLAGEMFVSFA